MSSLSVDGLKYRLGDFSLEVDLELENGQFGLILGPSGCGKSTLLRLLAGLLCPESGSILLGGRQLAGLSPEKRKVGLVFQDYALFPQISARRNMEYGLRLKGLSKKARTDEIEAMAASFHIETLLDRLPAELSGGEQQRIALARSLAVRPELLLLDEPLSSLDQGLRRELRAEIRAQVKEAKVAAIMVSHDLDEALAMADRIFVMQDGKIVEAEGPEALWESPRTAFAARLLGRGPVLRVLSLEKMGTVLVARTEEGDFPVLDPAPDQPTARGEWSLLLPSEKLSLVSKGTVPQPGQGVLEGRVISSAYRGDKRSILLKGSSHSFEIEVGGRIVPQPGEALAFAAGPGILVRG